MAESGHRQDRIIASVQVIRGVAALAVVVYHTHLILAQPEYGGHDIFGPVASTGWIGVNLFFVLSGFVILLAHRRDLGNARALPRYLWRRFVRLYPIYWICLTAYLLAASAGLGTPDFSWDPVNLAAAYLLVGLDGDQTLPLKVAWTLLHEVCFYAIFAILLCSIRAGLLAMALWLAAIVTVNLLSPFPGGDLLSLWNIHFLFGIAACWVLPHLHTRLGWPIAGGGLAVLLFSMTGMETRIGEAEKNPLLMLSLALGFTLLLLGAVLLERRYGGISIACLLQLGDASYSIYLVHSAVLSVTALLVHKLIPGLLPDPLLFTSAFVLAVAAGVAVHRAIERPMLSRLRRLAPAGLGRSAALTGPDRTAPEP